MILEHSYAIPIPDDIIRLRKLPDIVVNFGETRSNCY